MASKVAGAPSRPTALIFLLLWFVFSADRGFAQSEVAPGESLSLREAIRLAIDHNPAIREAAARSEMSAEQVVQARSGFFPRLDLVGGYSRTTNPARAFATRLNQGRISALDFDPRRLNDPDPIDNYSGGLAAVWPIYDSGRTWYGTKQAEMRQEASDLSLTRVRRQVIADTVAAYCALLTAREYLSIVRQSRETALANLRMVRARYQGGFVVKSDLLRTQVHVSDIQQQLFQAESQLEIAHASLNEVLGVAIDCRFEASDGLESGVEIADSLEYWIETALAQRTDLKRMDLELATAETEVQKMRAAYLPSISLAGDYMVNTEKFDDSADSYTIGAVVNFNLFSGLHDASKVRESLAALDAARTARDQLERRIRVEARQAYLLAQSAWKRIQVARDTLQQAEEALRIVGSRYSSGLLTVLDLLNSELELQQAGTRHLTALQDYRVARAQLMLAAGVLDETFE